MIGIGVGLLVNLLVWPPLRDRSAARRVDRIDDELGALLRDMAARLQRAATSEDDVEDWVERTRDLDHEIDAALGERPPGARERAAEPAPERRRAHAPLRGLRRRARAARAGGRRDAQHGPDDHADGLLRHAATTTSARAGSSCCGVPAPRSATPTRPRSARTSRTSRRAAEGRGTWPARGALLVNLRNILDAMGAVADAQPVRADVRRDLALS